MRDVICADRHRPRVQPALDESARLAEDRRLCQDCRPLECTRIVDAVENVNVNHSGENTVEGKAEEALHAIVVVGLGIL
jgi:hypothetical protein